MTPNEYVQIILQEKKRESPPKTVDEAAAYEVAQLLSGNFTYLLYEALWMNHFEMDFITQHLENLHDSKNHFGLVYFIFILANAVDFAMPAQFVEMSGQDELIPFLSAAIIEDWLDYDTNHEETEYDG
ncbi:MAG: hypothetical protein A2Y15_04165 [Clostridiales bacterium GWF2_36_10]|nr:MAG: hypothetical protein A2Y15_04165 [Clostridiales bacterium GWF2_36_10]